MSASATTVGLQPILSLRGIQKRFGALQALSNVDFEVSPGEVVALAGDNGAGKSTLVKVMSGIHAADDGEIRFEGEPVSLGTPKAATNLGIATVFQDLALCDNLSVVANLFLGREQVTPAGLSGIHLMPLDEIGMEHTTVELLESLSVRLPNPRAEVAQLSGGQRQSVAIARSLLGNPKVVLLDEPTAALGVPQTRQVLDLIERLRERGLAVVLISHNLSDIFRVADRIVVLRLGKLVGNFVTSDVTPEIVVAALTGANDPRGEEPTDA
ncbi:MAG: sugar ABC transporter ATP-binding protein [Thermoleophilia bacterium]|nr:sugar ABC transporter ATP-binding protein [Thermoleophilia bacterium]